MTIRCSELGEFEPDVFVCVVHQLSLWWREPTSLPFKKINHVPVTQFTDEWGSREFLQPLPVRNGSTKPVQILVFLNQWVPACWCHQDQDEVSTWDGKQEILLEPSVLP